MEAGAVAAAYGAETVVEGAVGAGIIVAKATMPIRARFHKIMTSTQLPRSSHTLSIVKGKAYVFGGDIKPREPVDNAVHVFSLPSSSVTEADYEKVEDMSSEAPAPRVGHTAVTIADRIFVFGGRGGKDMLPLEEKGRVWTFDTAINKWSHYDPVKNAPYPAARSYHASSANEHPLPSEATIKAGAADVAPHGTVFIHGGCPESGRLADAWAFDVAAFTWTRLPDAPGPARGGASLAFVQDRLYRFGGFDGSIELGGQIDYLEFAKTTSVETSNREEMVLYPQSDQWKTVAMDPNQPFPGNRSVAGLHPVTTGQGRNFLLLLLGERDPSSNGHDAAGQFFGDVWSYQIKPDGLTGASLKDATRKLFGANTAEGTWARVDIPEFNKQEGYADHPGPRGWFSSALQDKSSVVLWGGLDTANERQGDGFILTVGE